MKEPRHKEKREFMRAHVSMEALIEGVEAKELARVRARKAALGSPIEGGADPRSPLALMLGQAMDTLTHLEGKIDRILSLLETEKGIAKSTPEVEETIDISGSGMRMILSGPVREGQLVHLSLFSTDLPMGVLKLYGEITRLDPRREGNPPLYEAGIKFLELTDDEREAIIAYTFHLQRKRIRKSKEDE